MSHVTPYLASARPFKNPEIPSSRNCGAVSVIALWLGHESPVIIYHYVEADLAMKERALAKLHEPKAQAPRYRTPDLLIAFLKTL